MMPRLALVLISLIGIFLVPWWLFVVLALLGFILFPHYIEGCALALIFDLLYAGAPFAGTYGVFTIGACLVFVLREFIASRLRHDVFQA